MHILKLFMALTWSQMQSHTHTLEKHTHTHTKTHTNTHTPTHARTHTNTHTHVILTYISSDHSNSTDVIPQRVVFVPRLLPHHSKSGDSSALSRKTASIKETYIHIKVYMYKHIISLYSCIYIYIFMGGSKVMGPQIQSSSRHGWPWRSLLKSMVPWASSHDLGSPPY